MIYLMYLFPYISGEVLHLSVRHSSASPVRQFAACLLHGLLPRSLLSQLHLPHRSPIEAWRLSVPSASPSPMRVRVIQFEFLTIPLELAKLMMTYRLLYLVVSAFRLMQVENVERTTDRENEGKFNECAVRDFCWLCASQFVFICSCSACLFEIWSACCSCWAICSMSGLVFSGTGNH